MSPMVECGSGLPRRSQAKAGVFEAAAWGFSQATKLPAVPPPPLVRHSKMVAPLRSAAAFPMPRATHAQADSGRPFKQSLHCNPKSLFGKPIDWTYLFIAAIATSIGVTSQAQETARPTPHNGLSLTRWAREPMVMDPVALAFDDQGVLYVAETARRSTVDIDIRSHRDWLIDDLANQSVEDLRDSFHRWMAPERSLENAPWLPDYNHDGVHDWHDLEGVKERIRRLEDVGKMGVADRSTVFAEGFNEEISGVVAGVMPWGRDVWVTAYPNLYRLRDTDGDGRANSVETVFRGFGVHAAFDGHDLHGLTIGPEGKIYFSCGDNGFSVTNREGRHLNFPNTGGVLRMDPDGSNLEVFASGLRNPQEIAFDEYGNMFAVDNDGDLKDERERFVYIAEGSDSGWRTHWQFGEPGWSAITDRPDYNPWVDEGMWTPYHSSQPAHITPPLSNYSVGPGSLKFNPGTALNDAYRGYFFLIQFPVQKVTAFQIRPQGAGFEMVNEHTVLSGMMASAVNFSPDGALFVADWDGMWAPNGTGGIWVLNDPKVAGSELRREVGRLLREGMDGRPNAELVRLLGHADQRIRWRAQFELVRNGAREELLSVAGSSTAPQLARVHALWGLTRLQPAPRAEQLPLNDGDFQVRAQAAKAAGDLRVVDAREELVRRLKDPEPRVQFQAAISLGKIGNATSIPSLVDLLEANRNADPFLRHAAVMGLAGIGDASAIGKLSGNPSAAVRLGAVVALRRLRSPLAAEFLRDSDADVRREAVRAIHDDESIPEALEVVAALADSATFNGDEAITRRVLSANLRRGEAANAARLMKFALNDSRPEPMRVEAVEALAQWDRSPALDRVTGQVRSSGTREAELGRRLIEEQLDSLLSHAGPDLASTLTRIVIAQRIPAKPAVFAAWVVATNQPVRVRTQALEFLSQSNSDLLPSALAAAQKDPAPELRIAALTVLARRDPEAFLTAVRNRPGGRSIREQQAALRLAGTLANPRASAWLSEQVDSLVKGSLPPELALDVVEAARQSTDSRLRDRVHVYVPEPSSSGVTAADQLLLHGGDAESGRIVFRGSITGQCVRCHDAGGEGSQAGPVLTGIGQRVTREYLLEALLDPNAKIADGFGTVTLTLSDGEVLDGLRLKESSGEVTLRLLEG
ncbi:MAG TPA: hypothetical protein DCE44_25465, partial [Verrucomicrobiales bacterium]|nr:hypothetical protein [Verrucomicrobiales bacterium]